MFKLVCFIALALACVYAAPSPAPKPGVAYSLPVVAAPSAYVTGYSSQYLARNYAYSPYVAASPYYAAYSAYAPAYTAAAYTYL